MTERTSASYSLKRKQPFWTKLALTAVLIVSSLRIPSVRADGCVVPPDPQLWSRLREGQQTAVVNLVDSNHALVDLFVSMLDETGESHQVVFYVPLGAVASDFQVVEESSLTFDEKVTEVLDERLRAEVERAAGFRTSMRLSWLFGSMFINGGWSWPLWLVIILSGCGAAGLPAPIATFETASSQVDIYQVAQSTNLNALIQASGLDPSVRDTLSRLRGQQIAVVTLQTQPASSAADNPRYPVGQPGLHLSWKSRLVATTLPNGSSLEAQGTYAYPLGTGSAWAQPIELTRIYITAPPGIDFETDYPRLGLDASGYTGGGWSSRSQPRIQLADGPAFAVDEAVGDFGRIWRVTYRQSNSAEDVTITRLPATNAHTRQMLRQHQTQNALSLASWLLAPLCALAIWLFCWWLVMKRLGRIVSWRNWRTWLEAIGWAFLYPAVNVVGLLIAVALSMTGTTEGLLLAAVLLLITALGPIQVFLFARDRTRSPGVSGRKAAGAYVATVLLANAIYIPVGVLFLALTNG